MSLSLLVLSRTKISDDNVSGDVIVIFVVVTNAAKFLASLRQDVVTPAFVNDQLSLRFGLEVAGAAPVAELADVNRQNVESTFSLVAKEFVARRAFPPTATVDVQLFHLGHIFRLHVHTLPKLSTKSLLSH